MKEAKKNNSIQMVVCDMAGTTVNEDNLVYKTLQKAINEQGYKISLAEVLALGAGREKKQAITSILFNSIHIEDTKLVEVIYHNFILKLERQYQTAAIHEQDNAEEFFLALREQNIRIVLNTGYNKSTAESLLYRLGWQIGYHIDALITADDVQRNRPYPDMIFLAMEQFGIAHSESVAKVGDSIVDIDEGHRAGCKLSIGITTGAHTYDQLKSANPSHIVNNLLEILPLLRQ